MPELPEVETVCRGLQSALAGSVVEHATLRREGLRVPFTPGLAQNLRGRTIEAVARRAKYLLFTLDSGDVLLSHLGMSGRFSILPETPKRFAIHDHAVIVLRDGRCLIYNDARRFGLLLLVKSGELQTLPQLVDLGVEPLSPAFSASFLATQLKTRKAPVKPVLMDQALVVGVGNIYASEALYLAGIAPETPANACAEHSAALVKSVRKVLRAAIDSGGSSLRDFLHLSGEAGYFQHRFNVYGRKGEPCFRCQTPIRAISQAGRSSFFCPQCQK